MGRDDSREERRVAPFVRKPRELELRVMPDCVQGHDIILGRPFTEAPDLSYERRGHDLIFAEIDPSMFLEKPEMEAKAAKTQFVERVR